MCDLTFVHSFLSCPLLSWCQMCFYGAVQTSDVLQCTSDVLLCVSVIGVVMDIYKY